MDKKFKQSVQKVHNPFTGKMMEGITYSGKELLWKRDMTPEEPDVLGQHEKNGEK